jgi:hypothetical protein
MDHYLISNSEKKSCAARSAARTKYSVPRNNRWSSSGARLLLNHYQPVEGQPAQRDLTLDEMADTISTTRELVSKTLHRFAEEGMIKINRVEFVFMDKDQLETLAGHD